MGTPTPRRLSTAAAMLALVVGLASCDGGGETHDDSDANVADAESVPDADVRSGSDAGADVRADGTSDGASGDVDAGSAGCSCPGGSCTKPCDPLRLTFSDNWIQTDLHDEDVAIDCVHVDSDGLLEEDPGDVSVEVPKSAGANQKSNGRWEFSEPGVYDIQCSSKSLGATTTRKLVVSYEGIHFRYNRVASVLTRYENVMREIMRANEEGDTKAYGDAVDRLESLADEFPDTEDVSFLVENPHGWPTAQDLKDAGLSSSPDDSKWTAALDDLRTELKEDREVLQKLTKTPSESRAKKLATELTETRGAARTVQGYSPSEIAIWSNREEFAKTLEALRATAVAGSKNLPPMFREHPPTVSMRLGGFSVVGTVARIGINYLISDYTYSSILTDLDKSFVANGISIAIKRELNDDFEAGAMAPDIQSVHGSAAGYVQAGTPFKVYGSNFNPVPEKNYIVFIPPELSNQASAIVDIVNILNAIRQAGNIIDMVNEVYKVVTKVKELVEGLYSNAANIVELQPKSATDTIMEFGPLPKGANCNRLGTPVAGTMIPVNLHYGRGEAVNVNVHGGEPQSNCQ